MRIANPITFTLLLAVTLWAGATSAAITGVVVKTNGTVVAAAVDGVVTGEVSVSPDGPSGEYEVFWLDENYAEFQPTTPPHSLGALIGNGAVATFDSTDTWKFIVQPVALGSTTITFTLLSGGTPLYTEVPIPLHVEEGHLEADGFILRRNGVDLVHYWRGTTTGSLSARQGEDSDLVEVFFLSPDSVEFVPDEPHFVLRLDIADSSIVQWRSVDQWSFRLRGGSLGSTNCRLAVQHEDHDDFTSGDMPVWSFQSAATDLLAPASLVLARPFPNPAKGPTSLRFSLTRPDDIDLVVFDTQGRTVARPARGRFAAGSHAVSLDASALEPGLYFVRLRTPGGSATTRLSVTR